MGKTTQVHSVERFDLGRYLGLWYEIGRLPLKWEDDQATRITAEYSIQEDGTVLVDNRCFEADGNPTRTTGRAKPVDGQTGQLQVSFLPELLRWLPFTEGDYWVLKLDEEYQTALVGTPDHENLWLLSRSFTVSPATEAEYLAEAEAQGFDLAKWIRPVQDGNRVTEVTETPEP